MSIQIPAYLISPTLLLVWLFLWTLVLRETLRTTGSSPAGTER